MYYPLMFMTGWQEILLVLVVILLLFGARKLPELARSLGKSLGEFKKGKAEGEKDDHVPLEKAEEEKAEDKAED
jgi:sec-independent protein translocase protein TatA